MTVDVARAAALAGWFFPAAAPVVPALAAAAGIPRRLPLDEGIAVTFDDGPDRLGTPAVLDVLERHGATATFFLVGEQVDRDRGLAHEIAARGHGIAIHGYRHVLLLRRTPAAIRDDLLRAHHVVEEACTANPRLYRPPYGVFSGPALLIVRRLGWSSLLWSRWGRDWARRATPQSIAARATRALSAGDVILLHDSDRYSAVGSWSRTAAALPAVLEAVAAAGEPFVTASQSR